MTDKVDRILRLFEADGACITVDPDDEPMIRGAVEHYLAEGEDALLDLTLIGGALWTTHASHIAAWTLSTRAEREREADLLHEIDPPCHDSYDDEDNEPWRGR